MPAATRVGRGGGRPAFAASGGGGPAAWFTEDFADYANIAALAGTPGDPNHTGPFGGAWTGFYRDSGGTYSLANTGLNIDGFSLSQSLQANFPDLSGNSGTRCDNYTMRPILQPNGAAFSSQRHLWFDFYTRFSSNWTPAPEASWSCSTPYPDHKTWIMGALGGTGRWEVKIGSGAFPDERLAIKVGDPVGGESQNANLASYGTVPSEIIIANNLWNNQWHRLRVEVNLGNLNTANGAFRVWINGTMIHEQTGINYGARTGFDGMQMGANKNHGARAAMSHAWGLIRVFNTTPGW